MASSCLERAKKAGFIGPLYQGGYPQKRSESDPPGLAGPPTAYQAILGAAIPISSVPGLAVTAEYRFMGLAGDRTYTGGGVTAVRTDDYNHSVLFGIRYAFGAPAPAIEVAAPVAAPAPGGAARPLLSGVLRLGQGDLTDRARQIVSEAAATRPKCNTRGSR